MDDVAKSDQVNAGDVIVTAGWRTGTISSLYPRWIPVGVVSSVNQTDIDPNKQIGVSPYVDFSGLYYMFVLVHKGGS